MKKNWKLEDVALRSIEVFSLDISVKQAKKELGEAYVLWREENLNEGKNFSRHDRKRLEPGMPEWDEMMSATKDQFERLQEAIRMRRNSRKRLNHAITQVLTSQ